MWQQIVRVVFQAFSSFPKVSIFVACENIRFSSLFAAGDVPRERDPAAKSEEKRMFSQASIFDENFFIFVEAKLVFADFLKQG